MLLLRIIRYNASEGQHFIGSQERSSQAILLARGMQWTGCVTKGDVGREEWHRARNHRNRHQIITEVSEIYLKTVNETPKWFKTKPYKHKHTSLINSVLNSPNNSCGNTHVAAACHTQSIDAGTNNSYSTHPQWPAEAFYWFGLS